MLLREIQNSLKLAIIPYLTKRTKRLVKIYREPRPGFDKILPEKNLGTGQNLPDT